jgi:hypothetical protein|nr:MAG TPA: Terminase [Caudoviricetes sp.]
MKSVYYSLDKIKATNSDINIIIGQRGNGKSYSVGKECINLYKKTKKRFCYIRRWTDDIKGYRTEQLFNPLINEIEKAFGAGFNIQYFRHKFFLVDPNGVKVDIIGYALALSEASHTKSVSYVNVGLIWFDEIIQMAGETTLRDEKLKYENTISTICRDKTDIKFYLLGNTVSKFSWIFVHYAIDINKVNQGDIVVKELPTEDNKQYLRVALEYCEYNESIGKKTSKYTTSKMVTSGKWEIPAVDDIPTVKGEIVKDKLLFSVYDSEADITIGCFLRCSKWSILETDPETLLIYPKQFRRSFLILKTIDYQSSYYHLTNQKSLDYHTYNDFSYMLNDIKENTGIDFIKELYSGRIFSDNMFTADYFNHAYIVYNRVNARSLL